MNTAAYIRASEKLKQFTRDAIAYRMDIVMMSNFKTEEVEILRTRRRGFSLVHSPKAAREVSEASKN